jgi:hypothetical protein
MSTDLTYSAPRPKIFVVMPLRGWEPTSVFYAIKSAAEALKAEVVRVDKQVFSGDIMEQVYGGIKGANVIVADISNSNPNVMYEIGYAYSFRKILVLLKGDDSDPPFDIRQFQRIRYEQDMDALERKLVEVFKAAIEQSKEPLFAINIEEETIQEGLALPDEWRRVTITGKPGDPEVRFDAYLRNDSDRVLPPNFYAYLYSRPNCPLVPKFFIGHFGFKAEVLPPRLVNDPDLYGLRWQYRLNIALPALPSKASEEFVVVIKSPMDEPDIEERFLIRICTDTLPFNFPFRLRVLRPARGGE